MTQFGGVEHAFGRVEAKLDGIDAKLDRHAETLARHEVRIERVELDIRDLKDDRTHGHRQGMTVRGAIGVAICGAITSGLLGVLIQALNTR